MDLSKVKAPPYWLVCALEWPSGKASEIAECAAAFAPSFIPRKVISEPAQNVCRLATEVAQSWNENVLFFADVTGVLRRAGSTWAEVGVYDWEAATNELVGLPQPLLFLTLHQWDYSLICQAGAGEVHVYGADSPHGRLVALSEFAETRARVRASLERDWSDYVTGLERSGKLREA